MGFVGELEELLVRTQTIKSPINVAPLGVSISDYNKPSDIWMNDVEIFYNIYLLEHPLKDRIKTLLFHRKYSELVDILESIKKDTRFIDKVNNANKEINAVNQTKILHQYDVFISHANKDKQDLVDELNESLKKLGINIFYDKETLEWGDNWKDRILDGVKQAEFSIIVISENFFDREWTEKELGELLARQNRNGQKIILPILKNITVDQLKQKYPSVADIQAINSSDYSTDQIALLFAKQLIKRLKMQ